MVYFDNGWVGKMMANVTWKCSYYKCQSILYCLKDLKPFFVLMPRNNCEDLSWCWSILRKTFDGKKVVESAILVQTDVSHPHVLLTSLLHQHEYGPQCEVHISATLLLFFSVCWRHFNNPHANKELFYCGNHRYMKTDLLIHESLYAISKLSSVLCSLLQTYKSCA